jgi:CheY-like chemotaxis protein
MRILIADDNRDITDSFGILLEALGHEVATAYDGIEACDVATAFLPEAALLDIRMPLRHGYEVAMFLGTLGSLRDGCLIGMTGEGGPDAALRAREAGFSHLVYKPAEIGTIVALLDRTT